ncbi:MAG: hypothetical protein AB1486_03125 [Planctomycetota bacterium]
MRSRTKPAQIMGMAAFVLVLRGESPFAQEAAWKTPNCSRSSRLAMPPARSHRTGRERA